MTLTAETYQCSKEGRVEYGWTFKINEGDDSEFDLGIERTLVAQQP